MIDTEELRRLAHAATHPTTKGRWMRLFGERTVYDRMEDGCRGTPVVATPTSPPDKAEAAKLDFIAAANPATITDLLDRLEEAENAWKISDQTVYDLTEKVIPNIQEKLEAAEKELVEIRHGAAVANDTIKALCSENAALVDDMNLLRVNNTALRAKVEQMEKQEPYCTAIGPGDWTYQISSPARPGMALYTLPGAQPTPSVPEGFSREDLEAAAEGLDGYEKTVNVGNVTGEGDDHLESTTAYAARFIRAMLSAPETKPASSVPDGWFRAVDEALVVTHLGVANESDTYEQAKAKLDNLIGFHTDVASDPAVNGGYKLMPAEPTQEIYECFAAYDGTTYSNPFDFDAFREDYLAAINSTGLPVEAKLYTLPGAQGEEK